MTKPPNISFQLRNWFLVSDNEIRGQIFLDSCRRYKDGSVLHTFVGPLFDIPKEGDLIEISMNDQIETVLLGSPRDTVPQPKKNVYLEDLRQLQDYSKVGFIKNEYFLKDIEV